MNGHRAGFVLHPVDPGAGTGKTLAWPIRV
jgi:hypothetical protein